MGVGYPDAALADADHALRNAREIGQVAALMYALLITSLTHILCGNYATPNAQSDELVALADEKGAVHMEGARDDNARLCFCRDGESLGRSPIITPASQHCGQRDQEI